MTLHCLEQRPEPWLAQALERFERQFDYPLGPETRFRISHGRDYLPFFQAMGLARVYVIERSGEILGTLAHIERMMETAGRVDPLVHYLCDLKIAPAARGGRVLASLFGEAKRRIALSSSHACFSVVMGGTGRLPTDYTGRIGVPEFPKLAEVTIVRLSSRSGDPCGAAKAITHVTSAGIRIWGGEASLRSRQPRAHLEVPGAGGWLEDTRRGKQLWSLQGEELRNAHLSDLRFDTAGAAVELLGLALDKAKASGFSGVFFALPRNVWSAVKVEFAVFSHSEAPAAIYGYDLPTGQEWWINTSEI